ncbi:alpha/beta hydrolase [Nonlabens ponticola]|uniref:Alpha/beta hydrolase n=1 Tax=Nonlabens ponticola TaxID=2496866 RepID=A0A3S9MZR3_9FLAO|nr:alpha/beta hydrolase [Nonlabens ponticola]AZQ44657.1 alpha/beta hydrolase [Nonlabens ponticola]
MTKSVTYQHTNTYEVVNAITDQTKNIWICAHGLGYLATYFKKYFLHLDNRENSFIVLQAPSKYYQGKDFKHVGASWLTRVDTQQEIGNNVNYIYEVMRAENLMGDPRLVFFGYSQGVSIMTRLMALYNQRIQALIMHSGSIPAELNSSHASIFRQQCDRIIHISGTQDEYVDEQVIKRENKQIDTLFGTMVEIHRPDINHKVDTDLLLQISKTL